MKKKAAGSGFALIVTLVLLSLILIVVVSYLASTRIERSTASLEANRLRAKMAADSGLVAAVHLLRENTRYGNYVTAMPPSSPSPAPHQTEIYRPAIRSDPLVAKENEYLQFNNATGEILVSVAAPVSSPAPPVDPRPTPAMIYPSPPPSPLPPFTLPSPNPSLSTSNSFDFNQIVRVSSNASGRLVDPDGRPAFGQWVVIRNSDGDPIGRYAFFVEDESMKLNVNATGNSLASPNLRINDLRPIPATTPSSQIQEIDPTSLLLAANRSSANSSLISLGSPNARLTSKTTLALLNSWAPIDSFAHLLTTVSKDDNTTARGWQRMDLNRVVADAEVVGTNEAKVAAATKIANWMRDAWTGPSPLSSLPYHQMFNDERLRLQIAANIVDYIDQDSIPTDMGDVVPDGYTAAIPVIGTEKIPYLAAVEILYEASNSTCPTPAVAGTYSATAKVKLQFRFLNLYETDLDLAGVIGRIEVQGVPVLSKNGTPVLDVEGQTFTVPVASLKLPTGSGNCGTAGVCTVPAGADANSSSGAKTVQSDWIVNQTVPFTVVGNDAKPRLLTGLITVKVYGVNGERLDDTAIVTNLISTGYNWSGSSSTGDFLNEATPTKGALQVGSISLVYGLSGTSTFFPTGDPRYRAPLANDRWRNIDRSDATTPLTTNRIAQYIDTAEVNPRAFGMDWYDNAGDRPLAFIRNAPMLNIGELGNVSAPEYYWRTLYLQHPERPSNTSQSGPATEAPLRRQQSVDSVLIDLFRAGGEITRSGAININTQQQFLPTGGTNPILPLQALFLGVSMGTPLPSPNPTPLTQAAPAAAPSPADRLSAGVNLLVNSTTVAPSGSNFIGTVPLPYRVASISNKRSPIVGETITPDNNPPRPYFRAGEISSTLSRLLSASEASDTGSSSSRSKVVYSAMRADPQSTTTVQFYRRDFQVEQAFREVSNSITTRGNIFRILYVGQALNRGILQAEFLGEAFVERRPVFAPEGTNPDALKTLDSDYAVLTNRVITE